MIIAVTAKEASLQSEVDPRFGRAAYFLIANSATGEVYAHDNTEGIEADNGAGTGASQQLAEFKVDVLYTGHVGPKAAEVLDKAKIAYHENTTGTVEEVLSRIPQESQPQEAPKETVSAPENGAFRLAIPADSDAGLTAQRSGHFGKCAYYTLIDIKDQEVQQVVAMKNGGHVQGGCSVPVILLNANHVDKLIVAGIGGRPLQGFRDAGIEVYAGAGQTVQESVDLFLAEQLAPISNDQVCGGGA
ncbi:Predicted Fe-Mo cluster-binding protein, NifX family [Desulfuromusa kysingii]|uniref:Predicted Fe-Mo cluster-binding protein, NifX family n=1 Tax=Desulfuromusa kysingii TaxID=37625 RepID=A0A1H3W8G9_9BACT|nr:NifB/NifX family molybdenum-iron cluster-binding protein [Desulfuromusa kysingii]SDZ83395.1 Predicted Fe-Mo cluster-binding protein, NifX family [Desulfuromusa kysingii]